MQGTRRGLEKNIFGLKLSSGAYGGYTPIRNKKLTDGSRCFRGA